MILAALFFDVNSTVFIGFVIIAATPPGVAIIPFTVKLDGNLNNAIIGTFAAFLASIFIVPLLLNILQVVLMLILSIC